MFFFFPFRFPLPSFLLFSFTPALTSTLSAMYSFWPALNSSVLPKSANSASRDYLQRLKSGKLAFYAYFLSISLHFDFMQGQNEYLGHHSMLQLHYTNEATKLVQQLITQLPNNPTADDISDDLLASIISLSASSQMLVVPKRELYFGRFK